MPVRVRRLLRLRDIFSSVRMLCAAPPSSCCVLCAPLRSMRTFAVRPRARRLSILRASVSRVRFRLDLCHIICCLRFAFIRVAGDAAHAFSRSSQPPPPPLLFSPLSAGLISTQQPSAVHFTSPTDVSEASQHDRNSSAVLVASHNECECTRYR